MADKISVEIGLEGGEEVSRQLEQIGKSGEQAFSDIQGAADKINLNSAAGQFDDLGNTGQAAFQKIQTAASGAVAFEQVIQGVKKVEGSFEALGTAATKMATRMTKSLGLFGVLARSLGPVGIAVGVLAGAFVKFGNDSANALEKLTTEGAKLDLTAQKFDTLQKALTSLGVAPDSIAGGLAKLKESLGQDFFPQNVTVGLQNFIQQLERMPDGVARTQLAMQQLGEELGGQVIAGLQTGTISAQNFAQALGQVTPATQQQIVEAAKYGQALNQLNTAWTTLKASFAPIVTPIFDLLAQELKNLKKDIDELIKQWLFAKAVFQVFKAGITGGDMGAAARQAAEEYNKATQAIQADQQSAQTLQQTLTQTGTAGAQAGQQIAQGMTAAAQSTDQMTISARAAQQQMETLQRQAQFIASLPRPTSIPSLESQRPRGFADGGLLGGVGTGTSDSNLAWLSRGEYITPARAVSQPGVLAFLEALRRSGGNLSRVLDGMGRFALGGLVPKMPRFAAGGLAGGSNVTIQFPGLPAISGLRASADVVDQLHRAAALAQVRSGGRKPSRYS